MKKNKGPVTIRDVAKTAGVSVSTVSRVLNDKDDVSIETYERVQEVIAELGYASTLAAKGMRSRKTNVIGLVIPDLEDPFAIEIMKGVNQVIKTLDFDLLIYTGGDTHLDSWTARERWYVSLLNGSVVDGIMVVTPTAHTFATNAPLIAIDPHLDSTDFPAVIATNHEGAMAAMEYLISLGHRRIGFIGGRQDLQSAHRRQLGYEKALRQAGVALDPKLIQIGDYSTETARQCAKNLLHLPTPPTAIFAANDRSAVATVAIAEEFGLRLPQDLSIIGFDDIPQAASIIPRLTTVAQPMIEMGCEAAKLLINLIEGKPLDKMLYKFETKLIVRDTCQAV